MKEIFFEKLHLKIHTTDSPEALPYNFRSSTNVLLEKEFVPVDIATDADKMSLYLSSRL
ncbi:MAG TPA: hypothetical protein PLG94_18050 [Smithellaceae bacterium]|nr:hypothetical protein [Smithellaceae bacterium]